MNKIVLSLVCGLSLAVRAEKPVTLVDGSRVAAVVIAANAEESSKLAAEELTNYVRKVTGVALKVKSESEKVKSEAGSVYIGTLKAYPGTVPAAAKAYLESSKKAEASWTGTVDGNLHIVGKKETAELYATYHFIETKLGVIWFKAPIKEDPGEYVPQAKTLVLAPYAESREPAFEIRQLNMCCAHALPPPYGKITATRLGFQTPSSAMKRIIHEPGTEGYRFYRPRQREDDVHLGGGHMMFPEPIPPKRFGKAHPEYFALVGGKRVVSEAQYCMSNPEVQRLVADFIIGEFRKNNNVGWYLFGLFDTPHGFCECESCQAMDAKSEREANSGFPKTSTRLSKFAEIVMPMVRKEIPDADLRLWAYLTYRELPIGVRHDPRVTVQFCTHGRCYGHAFDDPHCARNVRLYKLLRDWQGVASRVYTYEYLTCSNMRYTCPEVIEAKDIRNYWDIGLVGWSNEAEFTGSRWAGDKYAGAEIQFQSCWQWLWMTGKMLWDPSVDGLAAIDRIEEKYYGVAYPAMRKYHALRRRIFAASPVCYGYPDGDARRPTLLNLPGAKDELLGYLDEADKLLEVKSKSEKVKSADLDVLKFRVNQDRRWFMEFWVKPNAEYAEKMSNAYRVAEVSVPPVIDGSDDDACWAGAQYVSDFRVPGGPALPKELRTHAGLLYDASNLYVIVKAKEPNKANVQTRHEKGLDVPVWSGEDAVEVLLAPPSVDQNYYHIAANLKGALYDAANPGGRTSWNSDAVVRTQMTAEGWTMEMKIPVRRMMPLERGAIWRILIARNRPRTDAYAKGDGYSLGGAFYHQLQNFLPIEIAGKKYLHNGSFEDGVNADGSPKAWIWHTKSSKIVRRGNSNAVSLEHGSLLQLLPTGGIYQEKEPVKVRISYRAQGPGRLNVFCLRYHDDNDPNSGKTRRNQLPSANLGTFDISEGDRYYTHDYTIPANEWMGLGFLVGEPAVIIDDVTVSRVD